MQRPANPVEGLVNGVHRPAELFSNRLEARLGVAVTLLNELSVIRMQLAEALPQRVAAEIKQVGSPRRVSGQLLASDVAQLEAPAFRLPPKFANLVVGNNAHPLHEVGSQIELIRHPPDRDANLLKHLFSVGGIRQQRHEIREQPAIVLGEEPRKRIAALIGRG